ncbi:hypothetical protein [Paraburkholderia sp. HD33-4]|uniref:hypothetical protein n=1 Tax=Paraburkholderia sp. HD33-4 TaxID=2883242 RepID=UPI001F237DE8|nr:hypothetical protein [Paraburkholderia sp. HD33-4]
MTELTKQTDGTIAPLISSALHWRYIVRSDNDFKTVTTKTQPNTAPVQGQWTGSFVATEYEGTVVIDLEKIDDRTLGSVLLFPRPGVSAPVIVGKFWTLYRSGDRVYASVTLNPTYPKAP